MLARLSAESIRIKVAQLPRLKRLELEQCQTAYAAHAKDVDD
jgi:hypothetical protein